MNRLANPLAPRRALPEKVRQIKAWMRELRCLGDDVVLSVTELACREEGCPDIETVIGIMRSGQPVELVRVHKPLSEVVKDDLVAPPA